MCVKVVIENYISNTTLYFYEELHILMSETIQKIRTATPEIHLADGKTMDQLEIVSPGTVTPAAVAPNPAQTQDPPADPAKVPAPLNFDDISDEEFNKQLERRTQGKIKKIEDLNPPVVKTAKEIEEEAEKKRNDARVWALETGKVKPEDYDTAAVIRSKSDRELALQAFTSSLQADDKDITPEEAEEIFKDVYHEGADEKSKSFIIGQKNIKSLADSIRKEHTSKLENIDSEYDEEVSNRNQFTSYKGQVKKISAELPKEFTIDMPYKYLDGADETISYKIPVDDKVLTKILAEHSTASAFSIRNILNNGKITEKDLTADIANALKAAMFDQALPVLLAANTKEIETRMEVVLGNKRNPMQGLNDGKQNLPPKSKEKNDYSALLRADSLMIQ